MNDWLLNILQVVLFVFGAPLLAGFVKWVKCQLQNRQSPSIFQPYRNLAKLMRKDMRFATHASWIFHSMPYLLFVLTVIVTAIVPLLCVLPAGGMLGDVIVLVGLFAFGRFFLALAGLDIGTAFGGMGASREMMFAAIAEPALLLGFLTVAMLASSTNLTVIVTHLLHSHLFFRPSIFFIAAGFALVALAENGRIPFDNPATHLELTMIHEAMILEYRGRELALIEWAAQIKLALYFVLFIDLFLPWGMATRFIDWSTLLYSGLLLVLKLMILTIFLGVTEASLAKVRVFRVPYLLNVAFIFSLFGMLIHLILEGN